jgi:hypothetical protein
MDVGPLKQTRGTFAKDALPSGLQDMDFHYRSPPHDPDSERAEVGVGRR